MKNHSSLPEGKRALPGALCGLAGALIVAGLWVLEYSTTADLLLKDWFSSIDFQVVIHYVCPQVEMLVASIVLAFVISWIVLDCEGFARQSFVILLVLVLLVGTSLLGALWGWLLNPLLASVAVCSSGLLAMLYALQHSMPCDRRVIGKKANARLLAEESGEVLPTRHRSAEVPSESAELARDAALSQSVEKVMMPFPSIKTKVGDEHGKD